MYSLLQTTTSPRQIPCPSMPVHAKALGMTPQRPKSSRRLSPTSLASSPPVESPSREPQEHNTYTHLRPSPAARTPCHVQNKVSEPRAPLLPACIARARAL
ncbi:hypothetical protein ACJQWK_05467 [Exserohilum turcicum]